MFKSKKYIFILASLFFWLLFFCSASFARADFNYKLLEGLPGIFEKGEVADFNGYITGLYNFMIWTAGIGALFMISLGGYMYIAGAANTSSTGRAKDMIKNAVLGLVMVFCTWLIINTINPQLLNLPGITTSIVSSVNPSTPTPVPTSGKVSSSGEILSAEEAKGIFSQNGIQIVSSKSCEDPYKLGCTSVDNIPKATVDRAAEINKFTPIKITGATEVAGHKSHGPGLDRLDIQPIDGNYDRLGAYLQANKENLGISQLCTPNAYKQYRINCPNVNEENHFHITGK